MPDYDNSSSGRVPMKKWAAKQSWSMLFRGPLFQRSLHQRLRLTRLLHRKDYRTGRHLLSIVSRWWLSDYLCCLLWYSPCQPSAESGGKPVLCPTPVSTFFTRWLRTDSNKWTTEVSSPAIASPWRTGKERRIRGTSSSVTGPCRRLWTSLCWTIPHCCGVSGRTHSRCYCVTMDIYSLTQGSIYLT